MLMLTEILFGALVTGTLFAGYGLLARGRKSAPCRCGFGECRELPDCAIPTVNVERGAAAPKEVTSGEAQGSR